MRARTLSFLRASLAGVGIAPVYFAGRFVQCLQERVKTRQALGIVTGGGGSSGWILATGLWADTGVWDDASSWID